MKSREVHSGRPSTIRLRPEDNVAVAVRHLAPGLELRFGDAAMCVTDPVPMGHKVALARIAKGEPVRKYGQIIGFAAEDIAPGAHVHTHNVEARPFPRDRNLEIRPPPAPRAVERRTFRGYPRADGRAGTRNYVAVISTVNCSASTSRYIAERIPRELLDRYPPVDGVFALTHKGGCAMQYGGPDHERLERVLAGFALHPNVGAYVIVGLGCETAQASRLLSGGKLVRVEGARAAPQPPVITIQEAGGITRTVERGVRAVCELIPRAAAVERTELPVSLLVLGTQCGGSDGASGVTANPALGVAADLLVAQGGTVILGETPEIYGAEHLLASRAVDRSVAEALFERIRWWEWYTALFGAEIDNNPSPGNKEGGLTTIYEKSLGAVAKGGSTALTAVCEYAEKVRGPGLVVMDTPGYDPVSLTGIVAGGANVCVFTTGRGSVYGCKPAPSVKVSTNTPLYERMPDDIDIDAGTILEGTPVEEVGRRIFEEILAVASGKRTKSEIAGVGEEEFAPWTVGPVL